MATRKRAKSFKDIQNQIKRLRLLGYELSTRQQNAGNIEAGRRTIARMYRAEGAGERYMGNMSRSEASRNYNRRIADAWAERNGATARAIAERARNRKYVDYTSDKAKAVSNG